MSLQGRKVKQIFTSLNVKPQIFNEKGPDFFKMGPFLCFYE